MCLLSFNLHYDIIVPLKGNIVHAPLFLIFWYWTIFCAQGSMMSEANCTLKATSFTKFRKVKIEKARVVDIFASKDFSALTYGSSLRVLLILFRKLSCWDIMLFRQPMFPQDTDISCIVSRGKKLKNNERKDMKQYEMFSLHGVRGLTEAGSRSRMIEFVYFSSGDIECLNTFQRTLSTILSWA